LFILPRGTPPVLLNRCCARCACLYSGALIPLPPSCRELGSCIGFWRDSIPRAQHAPNPYIPVFFVLPFISIPSFALVARLAERLNLMRLVFRDEVIIAMSIKCINTYCYLSAKISIKMLIAKGIYFFERCMLCSKKHQRGYCYGLRYGYVT
jgi:hypothetical protein